jgi:hypothetical protein
MSCDAVASAAFLWLAATSPLPAVAATSPKVASPPSAVAYEPLFADIIKRASRLKAEVETLRKSGKPAPEDFKTQVHELSDLDMKGHITLRDRGTDGDLKCILKGISQDLPLKLDAVTAAATPKDRDFALSEMGYLLNDNVEVITAPPAPPV